MSPTESTPYGTPVLVKRPGKADIRGHIVTCKPDGKVGVSTHAGYGYFDADRVTIDETPRQPRRR